MPHALHFLIYTAAGWLNRRQEDLIDYLREENRVLREQLGGRPLRLTDAQRRRLAIRGQKLGRRVLSRVAGIVTPDTILRWYRRLIAQKYDGSARRRRGRPLTPQAIGELVVRMAIENPRWGYTRIRGALANLGHEIGRNTVKRILLSRGMAPAPERGQRTPWKNVPPGALGRAGRNRSVHGRGPHAGGTETLSGPLRDRAEDTLRSCGWHPPAARRGVDGADGP